MVNKNRKESKPELTSPSTIHHIGESITEYLANNLAPRVTGDEEAIRVNAIEVSKKRLHKLRTDKLNESAAEDAATRDMMDYSVEIGGDPAFDEAVEKQRKLSDEVFLETKELPPPQE